MCRPSLGFAWEHVCSGTATFPGMCLLEMATAAGRTARDDGNERAVGIVGVTFSEALTLPESVAGCTTVLECALNPVTSGLDVTSTSAATTALKHVSAQLVAMPVRVTGNTPAHDTRLC